MTYSLLSTTSAPTSLSPFFLSNLSQPLLSTPPPCPETNSWQNGGEVRTRSHPIKKELKTPVRYFHWGQEHLQLIMTILWDGTRNSNIYDSLCVLRQTPRRKVEEKIRCLHIKLILLQNLLQPLQEDVFTVRWSDRTTIWNTRWFQRFSTDLFSQIHLKHNRHKLSLIVL